jgi:hypothetical protein
MTERFEVGELVKAFHPAMFGVVLYGRVVSVGRKWLRVDFGPIRGGVWRVGPADVTERVSAV